MNSNTIVSNKVNPHNFLNITAKIFFFFIRQTIDDGINTIIDKYPLTIHEKLEQVLHSVNFSKHFLNCFNLFF